jgi:superfamily II DNA or RNA helicase/diadenosine tetraphosphate (Ap4A) HIT family hydrolase
MSDSRCPFCPPEDGRVFHVGVLTFGLWDKFPVNNGHALLAPKRHISSWFEATVDEQAELLSNIQLAKFAIEQKYRPDGFNIGINIGEVAGQTIPHLHVHVIPRFTGDVEDPRGGVRSVVPQKANYLAHPWLNPKAPHERSLITGGDDPLFPHLCAHLAIAKAADIAVAFLLESGMRLLLPHLQDLVERGGRLRFLTGTYMGVTDPNALLSLLDLQTEFPDRVALRVFEAEEQSFHPKAYLFYDDPDRPVSGVAFVGSSNISSTALLKGVEWNHRSISPFDGRSVHVGIKAFEDLLNNPQVQLLNSEWIETYRKSRISKPEEVGVLADPVTTPPVPHPIQEIALTKLQETRLKGDTAGLVVLATGLGKTWLSAFDTDRPEYRRVLFVAHREEILHQAMNTYRIIRPTAHLGFYTGQEKDAEADVIFASIQTLGKKKHYERFHRDEFDYVVVDEFHHAFARSYRSLINYFAPKFLLGLTATPERTDGGNLLALCQENLVFRCNLAEGIRRGLLSPFHYFGVPDEVDYKNIPWRSSRFNEEALTLAVATRSRAENAFEQYRTRGGEKTLAFCCSTRHAEYMRDFFLEKNVRAVAVHSNPGSDPRAASLERLSTGEIDVLFAVDMFNEGVDLPSVDTVMMLRPTESRILWLQQFGRGLRKADGKQHLTVIDYIGNHRTFLLKPQTLFDLPSGDLRVALQLDRLERDEIKLPPGCEVTYDLEAVQILRSLLRLDSSEDAASFFYADFKDRHGVRPTALEMHHEGYSPRSVRKSYDSWPGFVDEMNDLEESVQPIVRTKENFAFQFLKELEKTPMTMSYKMLVLLSMIDAECFPGGIELDVLTKHVHRMASRSSVLQEDLNVPLDDVKALKRKLIENPIKAWTEGKGTGNVSYFTVDGELFRTNFEVPKESVTAFVDLTEEVASWRLAEYLDREPTAEPINPAASVKGLELGQSYKRKVIPTALGFQFVKARWEQGFVLESGHIFLLVTLEKKGMQEEHRYDDRFLTRDLFEWKSQNRHTQESSHGQKMYHHLKEEIAVHLLVRKSKLAGKTAAPFIYCGDVEFVDWEGERPITIRWRLLDPLSDALSKYFSINV